MASPNTTFVSGAILTAAQQNNFPRGVMAFDESITQDLTITTEEVQLTGSSFTAVANRYYKVTYFEPNLTSITASGFVTSRLRLTNISGTLKQSALVQLPTVGVTNTFNVCTWVGTLAAGTTNFVATLQSSTGTAAVDRNSTLRAFLLVEDIGPA